MKDITDIVKTMTKCPYCGAKVSDEGASLHVWRIDYECGCEIIGPIDNDHIYLNKKCPNEKS